MQMTAGPLLAVNLDGVLFQDLSFYGEDKLHSRRVMTASEMEAQRDRAAMKRLLAQGGSPALKDSILKILARREALPQLQGRIVRGHVMTNQAVAIIAPNGWNNLLSYSFRMGPSKCCTARRSFPAARRAPPVSKSPT